MPHVNNIIFLKSSCLFVSAHHRNNFGKQYPLLMKERRIHNDKNKLFLKSSFLAPTHITVNYLHFALISMEIEYIDILFKLSLNYDVHFEQTVCYESLKRPCSISYQNLTTSKMYRQRTKLPNMIIKPETNFLYIRWRLSTTSLAKSSSP